MLNTEDIIVGVWEVMVVGLPLYLSSVRLTLVWGLCPGATTVDGI